MTNDRLVACYDDAQAAVNRRFARRWKRLGVQLVRERITQHAHGPAHSVTARPRERRARSTRRARVTAGASDDSGPAPPSAAPKGVAR